MCVTLVMMGEYVCHVSENGREYVCHVSDYGR